MLHRNTDDGLVVIPQPGHAWISGQLAAAWGNAAVGTEPASRALVLAVEQHDIAWLDWEARPTLNPERGLPYAFTELPTADHLDLWRTAAPRALAYGRLPAVLISMHGTYLYRRFHDFDADADEDARLARAFLEHEEASQARLIASLTAEQGITRDAVERQRRLLSLWDAISLALCMGFNGQRVFDDVPVQDGELELKVTASDTRSDEFTVDPWPFAADTVTVGCAGSRLHDTLNDVDAMRQALSNAAEVQLAFRLMPI